MPWLPFEERELAAALGTTAAQGVASRSQSRRMPVQPL
jgi:hypothetical protein